MSADALEREVRACCDAGDHRAACTRVIEGYGPEVLGFLHGLLRDEVGAREVFAAFCEDLWRGIAQFRWESAMRTWAYLLARHALARYWAARRRAERFVSLSEVPELDQIQARVATTTLSHLRSAARARIAEIRATLAPEEQMILILRHDRELGWREIAESIGGEGDVAVRAARLRKRYERLLRRLRDLYERTK